MSVRTIFEQNTYLNDVQEIPRAFVPYLPLSEDGENYLSWHYEKDGNRFTFYIESDLYGSASYSYVSCETEEKAFKKESKYFAKNKLYEFLSKALSLTLPYGSLTGIRPTGMYNKLAERSDYPKKELIEKFKVAPQKADLIEDCALFQREFINREEKAVGLYVNIPFCPTRCSYCSFISTEIGRVKKEIPLFIECLKKNIDTAFEIIAKKGFSVRSVYFGGGTPSSIGAKPLREILSPFKKLGCEFTVECGRPDTVDTDIVQALIENNVTRVSINPQTFHQKTLDLIDRKHSVDQVYEAFSLLQGKGLCINCDLIAALPGEVEEDFRYSLDETLRLHPENITVHTLSIKRGSDLNKDGITKKAEGVALAMTDYAYFTLKEAGYMPYYMYRQKNTADNLENTGFCRDKKVCFYNIDTMEESASVLAVGAGAVSKYLQAGGKIERFSYPKGFREYCERTEETNRKFKEFFGID